MRTIFYFLFCLILTSQHGRRHVPWSAACVFSCSVPRVPLHSHPLPLIVLCAGFFLLRDHPDLPQALPEHDLAALVPEDFPWIVVNPFLRGRDLRRADLREICAFRMPPPDHAVGVLVAATLPQGIRMAVVWLPRWRTGRRSSPSPPPGAVQAGCRWPALRTRRRRC